MKQNGEAGKMWEEKEVKRGEGERSKKMVGWLLIYYLLWNPVYTYRY